MYEYNAEVLRVVDGDTIDLDVDLGFSIHHKMRVRLARVDTPETYGVKKDSEEYKRGMEAKEFVESAIPVGKQVTIVTLKDRTGKFGRYLAEILVDEYNLNSKLLEEGLATEYGSS